MTPVWREPEKLLGAFQRYTGQLTYINGYVRYTEYQDQGILPWFRDDQTPAFATDCIEVPLSMIERVHWRTSRRAGSAVEFRIQSRWYDLYFLPPAGYRLSNAGSGVDPKPMARVLQAARYVHHVGGAINMMSRALMAGDQRASRSMSDANVELWRAILGGSVPASIRTVASTEEVGVRAAIGQLGAQIEEPTLAGLQGTLTADAAVHLRHPMNVFSHGLAEDTIVVQGPSVIHSALVALRSDGLHIHGYDSWRSAWMPGDGTYWATQCATIQLGRGGGVSYVCISCVVSSTPDGWRIGSILIDTDKTARELLHAVFRDASNSAK